MKVIAKLLDRVIGGMGIAGLVCAAFGILAMCIPIAVGTISRYLFLKPFNWIDEYAGALMIPVFFMSLLYVLRVDKHIRVGLVADRLPKKIVSFLGLTNSLLAAAYGAFLCYEGLRITLALYRDNAGYINFELPSFLTAMFIPIGTGLFSLGCLALFISNLRTLLTSSVKMESPKGSGT